QRAAELEDGWLDGVSTLGITAGASAPEVLVQELIDTLAAQFDLTVEERNIIDENVTFSLPRALSA
ncbi:MAG: 4-hydroxy-3-methylbut-2-enyl diphosphate reductase, partial [Alphaproteobacteria bacterium]